MWEYKLLGPRQTKDQLENCGNKPAGDSVCNIPGRYSVVEGCLTKDFSTEFKIWNLFSIYDIIINLMLKLPFAFSASLSDTSITTLCASLGVKLVLLLSLGTSSLVSLVGGDWPPLPYGVRISSKKI